VLQLVEVVEEIHLVEVDIHLVEVEIHLVEEEIHLVEVEIHLVEAVEAPLMCLWLEKILLNFSVL
jgi:hypothetical protein